MFTKFSDRVRRYRLSGFTILYIGCSALPAAVLGVVRSIELRSSFDVDTAVIGILSMAIAFAIDFCVSRRETAASFWAMTRAVIYGLGTGLLAVPFVTFVWIVISCVLAPGSCP